MELFKLTRPIIIAHRGASAYAPENTLASFELALQQGAEAIELDAKLSADGKVMVIHDQSVDRTTSHTGRVKNLTCEKMQKMDAGSHFDIAFKEARIPTLEEVFNKVGHNIFINVELTNYASLTDDLPGKVADLVRRYELAERVFFSSFNPIALTRIRRLLPEAPIGLLALPGWAGGWARYWPGRMISYDSLHVELRDVKASLVQRTHHRGKKFFVYTVNQEKDMRRLFNLGVDGIFSDAPVLARQVIQEMGETDDTI
ncbi:glycerophosphodiester phosphodiesterase [Chloroflexota bacterium]